MAGVVGHGSPRLCPVPGAQQLELLRRLNLAAVECPAQRRPRPRAHSTRRPGARRARGRTRPGRPAPGRARASRLRRGPGRPAAISAHELLRVASVLLADDLVALGADPVATSWPRPWRRRVRLVGDPLVSAATRRTCWGGVVPRAGRGRSSWRSAAPRRAARPHLDPALLRDRRDAVGRVAAVLARARPAARPRRPRRVRTPLGRAPALRPGRHRPRPAAPPGRGTRCPPVRVPGADQAELARRVAAVVGLRVARHERPGLMRTLQQRIPDSGVAPVGVPARRARVGGAVGGPHDPRP